jgi:hypothetical protein
LRRAAMRSSASGATFGGSSATCSQPTGGEPGGEMRKFFSRGGGRRSASLGGVGGVGSARNTRRTNPGLKQRQQSGRSVGRWVMMKAWARRTFREWHRFVIRRSRSWLRRRCPRIRRR